MNAGLYTQVAGRHFATANLIAHAAATATEVLPIFHNPNHSVQIFGVTVIPGVAATGDNTNRTNLNLIDAGATGAGTTEKGNLDYATGTDAVANDAATLYSSTTGWLLDAGDVLAIQYEKVASGLAVGPYLVVIEFEPR